MQSLLSIFLSTSPVNPNPLYCHSLSNVNKWSFALALSLCVGIVGSYLPQHYRIIHRGSSEGLSPWFVLLGTTSSTCALAAMSSLPITRAHVNCCGDISSIACFSGLLTSLQIGLQWLCFFIIFLLFVIFLPRQSAEDGNSGKSRSHVRQQAAFVAIVVSVHLFLSIITEGVLFARFPQYLITWADINGTVSPLLAVVQYLPQIWTTFRLKSTYSLSIAMLVIQSPGSFVFALSIALDVGWDGWSVWLMYCISGLMQAILLTLAVIYALRDRSRSNDASSIANSQQEPQPDGLDPDDAAPSNSMGNQGKSRNGQSKPTVDENTPLLQRQTKPRFSAPSESARSVATYNRERQTGNRIRSKGTHGQHGSFASSQFATPSSEIGARTRAGKGEDAGSGIPAGAEASSVQSQDSYVTAIMDTDGTK